MQNHYIEGLAVLASECFAVTTLTKDLLIEEYVIAGVSFYYCSVFTLKYWAASSELCDELVQNELKKKLSENHEIMYIPYSGDWCSQFSPATLIKSKNSGFKQPS